jgi:hypothetical protein
MSETPKFVVAFDEGHNPRGKLASNYKSFQKVLESEGYICQVLSSFPITPESLQYVDILISACPDQSRYDRNEIKAIRDWVTESGGGLFLLSHAGGDKGRRSNLSELAEEYGMVFENDQVLDTKNNVQNLENYLLIDSFLSAHPIVQGLTKVCFRASSSLTAMNLSVNAIVLSGDQSKPPAVPLLVATDIEEGRVVGCGSYEMFRDKVTGGITFGDNEKLLLNIMDYLKTDKKYEMKKENPVPVPPMMHENVNALESLTTAQATVTQSVPSSQNSSFLSQNFESTIKITQKGELATIFSGFINEFTEFKKEIIARMEAYEAKFLEFFSQIISSGEEVMQAGAAAHQADPATDYGQQEQWNTDYAMNIYYGGSASFIPPAEPTQSYSPPPAFNPPAPPTVAQENQTLSPLPQMPGLTPLPQRPDGSPSYQTETYDYNENQAEGWDTQQGESWDTNQYQKPEEPVVQKPAKKVKINVDELKTELKTLTGKVDSVKRLKDFINKKHESGGMTEDQYKKQLDKLNNDIKAAESRIDEINALLKNH